MKNIYLYMCLLVCSYTVLAQNENNHWQLGPLDLNFSSNPPVVTTISGINDQSEYAPNGDITVSSSNGDMLFYFNGTSFYNKNYQNMESLVYIETPPSLYNYIAAVVVPHPTNSKKYYAFWSNYSPLACTGCNNSYSYYHYALIDFTTNSLGQVTESGDLSYNGTPIKNQDDFRPMTVARNTADNSFWLIVQGGTKLLSYRINASGLNTTPVATTPSGSIYGGSQGRFRIVPNYANLNALKLYGTSVGNQYLYSLDFNSSNGTFSNFQQISKDGGGASFEFSIDYQKVYLVGNGVMVKDLAAPLTTARVLNEFGTTTPAANFSVIQKDKNDNLLIGSTIGTANRNKYLHKINNPDLFSGSSVITNYVYLNGKINYTLPQLVFSRPCVSDITLSAIETNVSASYKASNTITTNVSYTVNSGSTIVLQAQNIIYLEPNTDIKAGSNFDALIADCNLQGPYAGKLSGNNLVAEEEQEPAVKPGVKSLQLYPNPSTDITKISIDGGIINTVTVTSIEGLTMFKGVVNKAAFELDVQNYKRGIYIVTVQNQDGTIYTDKLMKN